MLDLYFQYTSGKMATKSCKGPPISVAFGPIRACDLGVVSSSRDQNHRTRLGSILSILVNTARAGCNSSTDFASLSASFRSPDQYCAC